MLLPSRKPCRIVITAKSLTLHLGNEVIVKPYGAAITSPTQLITELTELLLPYQTQLKSAKVKIVLANYFVRYSVMPWRNGISKQKDWLAIADNYLRQLYGQTASKLHVEVIKQGYAKPVLIAATDNTIIEKLDDMAMQQRWRLEVVQPAFVSVVNHFNRQLQKNVSVLLIEPQRIVLAQASDGYWQGFSVAMPVPGEEAEQAKRLLNQADAVKPILFYGHDAIARQLTDDGVELEQLHLPESIDFKQNLGYGYLA